MGRYTLFFVIVAAAVVFACKNEAGVPSTLTEDELLPLAAGNFWEFRRTGIDSNGVPTDSSSLSMTVGQPDTFGTEKAYPVSNIPFVFVDPGPLLWANKSGGLYNVIPGPFPPAPAFVRVFQFPTVVGDSSRYSGHTIRTTLVSEQVVVPAGSFTCVRYDIFQGDTLRGRLFFAPNIGIVKVWQRYYAVSALVDELRSYQLR